MRVLSWSTVAFQVHFVSWTYMKKDCIESRDFSRSLVQSSAPSRVIKSGYYGVSGLENHKTSCTASLANLNQCTAVFGVQKFLFESSLCLSLLPMPSVFPLCTTVVRMPPFTGQSQR